MNIVIAITISISILTLISPNTLILHLSTHLVIRAGEFSLSLLIVLLLFLLIWDQDLFC